MAERLLLGDSPASFADDERKLSFVIKLLAFSGPNERRVVRRERGRRSEEKARIFGQLRTVAIFLVAVAVIDSDADDLLRVREQRCVTQLLRTDVALASVSELGEALQ